MCDEAVDLGDEGVLGSLEVVVDWLIVVWSKGADLLDATTETSGFVLVANAVVLMMIPGAKEASSKNSSVVAWG
jgi:hypothetical protein